MRYRIHYKHMRPNMLKLGLCSISLRNALIKFCQKSIRYKYVSCQLFSNLMDYCGICKTKKNIGPTTIRLYCLCACGRDPENMLIPAAVTWDNTLQIVSPSRRMLKRMPKLMGNREISG